jgi:hypothetical protein
MLPRCRTLAAHILRGEVNLQSKMIAAAIQSRGSLSRGLFRSKAGNDESGP